VTGTPQCEFEFFDHPDPGRRQVLCEAPQTARVECEATGDSLRTCTPHARQLAAADPDVTVTWLGPEPELEAG
jgi:hypothetical protein